MIRWLMMSFVLLVLQGCVAMKPTTLPENFWKEHGRKVAVNVENLPKPTSTKLGSQGLLDAAINEAMSNGWDAHVESMVFEPYSELSEQFVTKLNKLGFEATPTQLKLTGLPPYKATPAQKKVAVFNQDLSKAPDLKDKDYLLLVSVRAFGTARSYYGFVPLSDPNGYFTGYITVVDVKSNEIKWWKDVVVNKATEKPWDQAPAYPNLSQAIDQAVEQSKQSFLDELFAEADKLVKTANAK